MNSCMLFRRNSILEGLMEVSVSLLIVQRANSLKIKVFWNEAPCSLVDIYNISKETSASILLYPVDGGSRFLRSTGFNHPTTRRHIPQDWPHNSQVLQAHHCINWLLVLCEFLAV
jgi:hypothetical protein